MRLLLSSLIIAISFALTFAQMDSIFEWNYIDYVWNSDSERQEAINNGKYAFGTIIPMDVDRSTDGRVFVSFLGARGVPATLGVVSDRAGPSGPLIAPYPDWSYFNQDSCDSIMNVYRIAIDECNRLWVLDTGFLEGEVITCPAKLWSFDLNTNTLLNKIILPNEVARTPKGETMLTNPIVETEGPYCENTTVYMAESVGGAIIIWNGVRLFRLESPIFQPVEGASLVSDGFNTLNLNAGVVGMDVSPRIFPGEPRFLYFRSLASYDLYGAATEVFKRSTFGETIKFFGRRNLLSSQALGQAFSSEGTLFLGMSKESGIACWNRYREMIPENIALVAQNQDTMRYPNGVKVIPPNRFNSQEELLVLSNRFIGFQSQILNPNEKNFHVLSSPVQKLIGGTKCAFPNENKDALSQIDERLIVN